MNYTFKLGEIKIKSETQDIDVSVNGVEIEVTDININQMIQLYKEMPAIVKEIKDTIEDNSKDVDNAYKEGNKDALNSLMNDAGVNSMYQVRKILREHQEQKLFNKTSLADSFEKNLNI